MNLNSQGRINSKISNTYKLYYNAMMEVAKDYGSIVGDKDEESAGEPLELVLPTKLFAYNLKKEAVNKLAESLDFQTFVFRCGWTV